MSVATEIAKDILDNCELWHTDEGKSYISMKCPPDDHVEHLPLKSKDTKNRLANIYYQKTKTAASEGALTNAIAVLDGEAQQGLMHEVRIRIGGVDGAIFLDLGDPSWNAVEITDKGWKVIPHPPVKFRRTKGMLPLPKPVRGDSLDEDLRPLLTVDSDETWLLIKGWLLGLLLPNGPHPIMAFRGEQDTAKSYTQKLLRDIVDPTKLKNRRPAKKVEDLMIAASNNWVVSFDNMSKIGDDLSDDLCCVATGGGIAKRTQHTDEDETILEVCRPIIMNGIENIITRPDLLDRSIYITLHTIPPESRVPEVKLLEKFNKKMPKILGALLDLAVIALQKQDEIVLNEPYRMAGFVKFATAGLGDEGDAFQTAYKVNKKYTSEESIADNYLVVRLREFIPQWCRNRTMYGEEPCWQGIASKLLDDLKYGLDDTHAALLPRAPNALSSSLTRLTPPLRTIGIKVEKISARMWKISETRNE